eukprot:comp22265_c1_seq1/m.53031 comp22265_c1_seq1/g.53031  ORF comp22265_c1_seq1/g.53031 comp22265_c1_seq1/m.53031 type:complete len:439 (+) comp22265_c1_seq1:1334-2650(+)
MAPRPVDRLLNRRMKRWRRHGLGNQIGQKHQRRRALQQKELARKFRGLLLNLLLPLLIARHFARFHALQRNFLRRLLCCSCLAATAALPEPDLDLAGERCNHHHQPLCELGLHHTTNRHDPGSRARHIQGLIVDIGVLAEPLIRVHNDVGEIRAGHVVLDQGIHAVELESLAGKEEEKVHHGQSNDERDAAIQEHERHDQGVLAMNEIRVNHRNLLGHIALVVHGLCAIIFLIAWIAVRGKELWGLLPHIHLGLVAIALVNSESPDGNFARGRKPTNRVHNRLVAALVQGFVVKVVRCDRRAGNDLGRERLAALQRRALGLSLHCGTKSLLCEEMHKRRRRHQNAQGEHGHEDDSDLLHGPDLLRVHGPHKVARRVQVGQNVRILRILVTRLAQRINAVLCETRRGNQRLGPKLRDGPGHILRDIAACACAARATERT